jgi:hypothetical protein
MMVNFFFFLEDASIFGGLYEVSEVSRELEF